MRGINDTSFKKIFSFKKYKDLYDFSSLECWAALLFTIILDVLFFICSYYLGLDTVVLKCINVLDNIGISLIGFLGFIVTGLAILTGAISSKVVKKFKVGNKMDALERILLSFYLIGLVGAIIISLTFILHFISLLPFHSNCIVNILLLSILSYLIIFIIFYSVKLIGNCIELFYIINSLLLMDETTIDCKTIYNNYRITALEKIQLSSTSLRQVQKYKETIKELIENDNISKEEQQILLEFHKKHFGE